MACDNCDTLQAKLSVAEMRVEVVEAKLAEAQERAAGYANAYMGECEVGGLDRQHLAQLEASLNRADVRADLMVGRLAHLEELLDQAQAHIESDEKLYQAINAALESVTPVTPKA